jgi:hypothetical protein
MKNGTALLRALAAALLVVVLTGAWSHVSAQDSDSGASDISQTSVDVSCWSDADSGGTACAFAPTPAGSVSYLTVPSALLCAPVLSTGAADWTADGISQSIDDANPSIVLIFDGVVSAGGGGSYGADLDGAGGASITGAGVACGDNTSGDVGGQAVDDPTAVPTDDSAQSAEEPVDATPTSVDTSDGNGDTPDPVVTEEPTVENQAATVSVTVGAFDCAVDPGAADPSTVAECQPSAGVGIDGNADSVDLGTLTTDGTGYVVFTVDDQSALTFTEDPVTIRAGYSELGSGTLTATASDGLVLNFVHIGGGRLQLVNGSCPTAGDTRTEFRIIEPQSVAAAATPACSVTPGAVFTISGDALAGDLVVTTGDDGSWRGYLPAGDYTVTENASGASANLTVVADDITVAIAVDYVSAPLGVVNVSRFQCDNQDSGGIAIAFSGKKPTFASDHDCTPTNGDITIDVQSEVSTSSYSSFSLGANGVAEVELPSGSYLITDVSTGKTATFDLDAGTRLYIAIVDKVVGGESVGGGGGDDPGGSDGTGSSDPTPVPGGGQGSDDGSVDGTGVDAGSTDGGVDAGADGTGADDGVADISSLPNTGARERDRSGEAWIALMLALAGAAGATGYALRRRPGM